MRLTAYGAGPDVFFPNVGEVSARKKDIAARHGIELRVPLDNELDFTLLDAGLRIYRANRAMMEACDICIANLTPFRGPSADDGTAFEVGFFDALGKPVFAYSNAAGDLASRTRTFLHHHPDPASFHIEDFGFPSNLMLPGALLDRGGLPLFTPETDVPYDDLSVFERLVKAAAARLTAVA